MSSFNQGDRIVPRKSLLQQRSALASSARKNASKQSQPKVTETPAVSVKISSSHTSSTSTDLAINLNNDNIEPTPSVIVRGAFPVVPSVFPTVVIEIAPTDEVETSHERSNRHDNSGACLPLDVAMRIAALIRRGKVAKSRLEHILMFWHNPRNGQSSPTKICSHSQSRRIFESIVLKYAFLFLDRDAAFLTRHFDLCFAFYSHLFAFYSSKCELFESYRSNAMSPNSMAYQTNYSEHYYWCDKQERIFESIEHETFCKIWKHTVLITSSLPDGTVTKKTTASISEQQKHDQRSLSSSTRHATTSNVQIVVCPSGSGFKAALNSIYSDLCFLNGEELEHFDSSSLKSLSVESFKSALIALEFKLLCIKELPQDELYYGRLRVVVFTNVDSLLGDPSKRSGAGSIFSHLKPDDIDLISEMLFNFLTNPLWSSQKIPILFWILLQSQDSWRVREFSRRLSGIHAAPHSFNSKESEGAAGSNASSSLNVVAPDENDRILYYSLPPPSDFDKKDWMCRVVKHYYQYLLKEHEVVSSPKSITSSPPSFENNEEDSPRMSTSSFDPNLHHHVESSQLNANDKFVLVPVYHYVKKNFFSLTWSRVCDCLNRTRWSQSFLNSLCDLVNLKFSKGDELSMVKWLGQLDIFLISYHTSIIDNNDDLSSITTNYANSHQFIPYRGSGLSSSSSATKSSPKGRTSSPYFGSLLFQIMFPLIHRPMLVHNWNVGNASEEAINNAINKKRQRFAEECDFSSPTLKKPKLEEDVDSEEKPHMTTVVEMANAIQSEISIAAEMQKRIFERNTAFVLKWQRATNEYSLPTMIHQTWLNVLNLLEQQTTSTEFTIESSLFPLPSSKSERTHTNNLRDNHHIRFNLLPLTLVRKLSEYWILLYDIALGNGDGSNFSWSARKTDKVSTYSFAGEEQGLLSNSDWMCASVLDQIFEAANLHPTDAKLNVTGSDHLDTSVDFVRYIEPLRRSLKWIDLSKENSRSSASPNNDQPPKTSSSSSSCSSTLVYSMSEKMGFEDLFRFETPLLTLRPKADSKMCSSLSSSDLEKYFKSCGSDNFERTLQLVHQLNISY